MQISSYATEANGSPAKLDKMQAIRLATQGSSFFLSCLVATLLAVFFSWGEASLPPVVAAWTFFAFFLVIRLSTGGSLWPALAGGITAILAIGLNAGILPDLPQEGYGKTITFRAVITDRLDRYDSVLLELDSLEWPTTGWNASGKIRLSVTKQEVSAQPGDRIEVTARLRRPDGNKVPGSLDYGAWLKSHGYIATGHPVTNSPIRILEQTDQWYWNRWRYQISRWIVSRLPPTTEGLAEGLIIGKRGFIDAELNDALQVSGTFHLLAISGQHLAMVAGWSFFCIRWMLVIWIPVSRRWDVKRMAAILTMFPLLGYSQLAGWSVSTQRATLTTGLMLIGLLLWRRVLSINTLILSAIILLFIWPRELFGAGFHLTFVSVAALLLFLHRHPMEGTLWRQFWLMAAMTLFLGLATAPVVSFHFHRVTPYGFFGNVFGVPWIGLLSVPLGLGALLLHGVRPEWSHALLDWMSWSLEVFIQWIDTISHWPYAWQRIPGPSLWGISWSVALFAASFILPWKRGRHWLVGLGMLALLWPREGPITGRVHVACLDVGQALAIVVRDPDGRWMVIDAGGVATPRFNVGEGLVSAYLWHNNARQLERIIISHPQKDHMAGVAALLRNFPVKELWLGVFPEQEQTNRRYQELIQLATENGVAIRRIDHELQQGGSMTVTALAPQPGPGTIKDNDHSLVIRISMGQQQFLFPGDLEAKGEEWFVKNHPSATFSVVVAPHHGSKTSSTPDFISTLQAKHVVFSSDSTMNHKIPHPEILSRWIKSGATLWRTDHQGTVVWETDGHNLWFQPPNHGG
ncbi:MAG: DNA internalization-related competence protein ComEC/Rec2 [Magnetococcales bacterium]|nr:DNA internalization-related competence protein ComEC/Rec2 [Magnetococcales bacterium]